MALWTNKGKADLAVGGITGRTFRALLVDPTHVPLATMNFAGEAAVDELAGPGYQRLALADVAVVEDDAGGRARITCTGPLVWPEANFGTVAGAWILRHVTDDTDSPLWCFLEATPNLPTNGGDLYLNLDALGLSTVE